MKDLGERCSCLSKHQLMVVVTSNVAVGLKSLFTEEEEEEEEEVNEKAEPVTFKLVDWW